MDMRGNTILITGGGTGIGRALAEAFHALDNQVVIAGRRQEKLDEVTAANHGMRSAVLDIENAEAIRSFAAKLEADFPALNVVIHNAGIMRDEPVRSAGALETAEATVTTNLLGPIRLNTALLPLLLAQPKAAILTVSSGLAFVPLALTPTYSATKAAIHAYTQALRYQLQDKAVQVIELIPPYVQTELQGSHQASDPHALPLADYIRDTMHILASTPDVSEVIIERAKPQRFAEASGQYDAFFKRMNDALSARRAQ